ncbi:Ribokinase-like protein [Vararia minispora EC-137]|uniref:Ribokinase-like protein n=1 Tax=Vararia minispora EC-137 TaxID=1314806 RepID=A0ACB8QV89_9AGAM|nr:Ribokinase-like protein [Vararia minispora EC-137]
MVEPVAATAASTKPVFATLGLFIIDEFSFSDENGNPTNEKRPAEIGGGGTYAAIGARMWLPPRTFGMVIDAGTDFPQDVHAALKDYSEEMWCFRTQEGHMTTRALNIYRGQHRDFEYLTPRIRLTPRDLVNTRLADPLTIHFVCSPKRAHVITSELRELGWNPTTIYEPIPFRCVPEELPSLLEVLPAIDVLSPNAGEALSLLSVPEPVTREKIEQAAKRFVDAGVGSESNGFVVIRSGEMGSYVLSRGHGGEWIDAYWQDQSKVIDVTGAGNAFLGGLAAGITLESGDVYEAALYGTVSASFVIEQGGLPHLTRLSPNTPDIEEWNGDSPRKRLEEVRARKNRS